MALQHWLPRGGLPESTPMISCYRSDLEARCSERGYTMEAVRACITSEDGDQITVDEKHPAYPSVRAGGVGSELSRILAKFFIQPQPGCNCAKNQRLMDEKGPEWVKANRETVVGWLREEAKSRGLPFFDAIGHALVARALADWDAQSAGSPDINKP